MDRIRAQAVERLLDKLRNRFPFSAKTRQGIGLPVAMLAALAERRRRLPRPSRTVRGGAVEERSHCRSIRQIGR